MVAMNAPERPSQDESAPTEHERAWGPPGVEPGTEPSAAEPAAGEASDDAGSYESAYEPAPRRVVTMGRGAFLTMVIGGLAAIVVLGAATVFLALDRGDGSNDPVVATVNGEEIRRSDYDQAVAQSNGEQVLDQLILERLITAEAQRREITVDDQEATRLLDDLRQQEQLEDDEVFQLALEQAGLTEEGLAHQLRLNEMIRRMVADQTQVSDQEVDSEYQANQAAYAGQDEAQAKALIKSDLQQEKESSAAQGLLQQLRAGADVEMKLPGKVQS